LVLDAAFAVPGDLEAPTGGYAFARKLLRLVPEHGVALRHLPLPGGFPHPSAADLAEAARRLRAAAPAVHLIDGLAYGAMPAELVAGLAAPVVALVHHPLGLETGLSPERKRALIASEAAALALARTVIASSRFTARLLAAEFGVPREKLRIAEPGTEPAARARGTGSPVALLAIGALSPRKAYDDLVHALAGLTDLDWRLTIVGARDRSPEAARTLDDAIASAGLGARVALAGAVDDATLERLYAAADLFVSPSRFEGYGMVLAEAMARGLPLVASTGGAAAETLRDEAGLKVPPGDRPALSEALRRAIGDPGLRRRLAEGSWRAGQRLPRWSDTAAKVAAVLREAAG
jgi:glycosyltransferase involved in cell wall biosynthesis